MFKNIFSSQYRPEAKETIVYEASDFCFESALLDIQCVMEDTFFDINKDHMTATHIGLKYGDENILREGFEDFKNSVVDYFKRLIEKIKEFMKKVFMFINAFMGDFEKFINKYKNELMKKKPNFQIQGYKYTIDENNVDTSIIQELVSEYNSELNSVEKMTKEDVIKLRKEKMSKSNLETVRQKILGVSYKIEKDEFKETCKKLYRDGEEDPQSIDIDSSVLQETINSFSNIKKAYVSAKKEKDKLIAMLESLKNFFQKSASVQYINGSSTIKTHNISLNSDAGRINKDDAHLTSNSTSKLEVYNTFFNFKFAYAKEVSNICSVALTERVTALKDQLKQSKEIVRKSMTASEKEKEGEN